MLTLFNGFNGPDRSLDDELRRMNKLFSDYEVRPRLDQQPATVLPRVDVAETEQGFELAADIPGLTADEIEVTIHEGVLTISAAAESQQPESKDNGDERARKMLLSERQPLSFKRSFRLGEEVDAGGVEATVKDGVLTVTLPKAPQAQPRQIAVKAH